jgi:hypothetical protein
MAKAKEETVEETPAVEVNEADLSTHQRYLNSLLGGEQEVPVFNASVNPDHLPTDEGYVGVDPIYQNHANDTEKPYAAEGGADGLAEDAYADAVDSDGNEPGDQLKAAYGDVTHKDAK